MSNHDRDLTVVFRLPRPYSHMLCEAARVAGVGHNHFARIATMSAVDKDLLGNHEKLKRIEEVLVTLRQEFMEALE